MLEPIRQLPSEEWEHYSVWHKVYDLIESLPNHFKSEIVIKGINVTDIYAIGNLFSAIIESQIVDILNKLRDIWDSENKYSNYSFIRQSQTFPDILLANLQKNNDIIFGIELKAWYVFSKESEPSFRFAIIGHARESIRHEAVPLSDRPKYTDILILKAKQRLPMLLKTIKEIISAELQGLVCLIIILQK